MDLSIGLAPWLNLQLFAVAIERSRELLGSELAALVGESYERAYGDMVRVQQLTELEEVIRYQQSFAGATGSGGQCNEEGIARLRSWIILLPCCMADVVHLEG